MINNGFGITGTYEMELNIYTMFDHFIFNINTKKNLIVDNGLEFFLKRSIDNDLTAIGKIGLGIGVIPPSKSDMDLEEKTIVIDSINSIELSNKRIKMVGHFTSSQVNETSEIGVFTKNNRLISRNVHEKIRIPSSSSMTINYYYSLTVGSYKYDWAKTSNLNNVYEISESVNVSSVLEEDTGAGYVKKDNRVDVDDTPASYYYDNEECKLYIHTSDSSTPNQLHIIAVSY